MARRWEPFDTGEYYMDIIISLVCFLAFGASVPVDSAVCGSFLDFWFEKTHLMRISPAVTYTVTHKPVPDSLLQIVAHRWPISDGQHTHLNQKLI